MKKKEKNIEVYQYSFTPLKSYSAEEILEAGGTTAFALKMGKSGKKQMEAIAEIEPIEFSETEWSELESYLKSDK